MRLPDPVLYGRELAESSRNVQVLAFGPQFMDANAVMFRVTSNRREEFGVDYIDCDRNLIETRRQVHRLNGTFAGRATARAQKVESAVNPAIGHPFGCRNYGIDRLFGISNRTV